MTDDISDAIIDLAKRAAKEGPPPKNMFWICQHCHMESVVIDGQIVQECEHFRPALESLRGKP